MSQDRAELCRLMVVGPTSQVDVSLPTHVPLADIMPALLKALGPDLADRGLEHSGWILQRLGGRALDESRTVSDLELLDGEMVQVRPRTDEIPPLAYDDLVDGVAAGMRQRSGLWRPQMTRQAALLLLVVWLGVGMVALWNWPAGLRRTAVLGATALVCFAIGYLVRRRYADRALAAILGTACVVATALTVQDLNLRVDPDAPGLLAAAAATLSGLLLVALLSPHKGWRQATAGALLLWLLGAAAVGLIVQGALSLTTTAIVMAIVTTALRPGVPSMAFRLAGFSLPDLPAEPEDLQQDIEPREAPEVLGRAAVADQYMTALYTALGLVGGSAMVLLAISPGWLAPLAAWLLAIAQLLVIRPMTSLWHRLALGGPALIAIVTWCLTAPMLRSGSAIGLAMGVSLALAIACVGLARLRPGRRISPALQLLGDWAHVLALAALGPVAAAEAGLIELVRGRLG